MKLCISVGLAKVKVGLVIRVTNTLLELTVAIPDWERAERDSVPAELPAGVGVVGVTIGTVGVTIGELDVQIEGCP